MSRFNILLFLIIFWVFRNTILIRGRTDYSAIDLYGIVQIAAVFLIAGVLFILFLKSTQKTMYHISRSSAKWFFLIYLYGLLSTVWSPFPLYSGYRAFEALVLFLGIFVLFSTFKSFQQAEKYFLRLSLLFVLLSFIGQLKAINFNISLASLHTNGYSFVAMILFLYAFGELLLNKQRDQKRRKALKRYAWISFFLVALGTSAATNIATAIGVMLLVLFTNRKDLKIAFVLLGIPFVVVLILVGDSSLVQEILFPGKTVEGISSMTGRMHLWNFYMTMIYEKLYFGWGFSIINRISDFYATNMHNSFLSILGGMGLVGLILFISFIISSSRTILKLRSRRTVGSLGSGAAFAGILVNSMSVGVIGEAVFPVTLQIALFMAFLFLAVRGQVRVQQMKKGIA